MQQVNLSSQPVTGNISLVELTSLFYLIYTPHTHLNTELNADEVALEHFAMNTNDAYGTNTAEIATTENVAYMTTEITTTGNAAYMTTEITATENVAYMTTGDAIPATQNVAYGQVPPGTEDCYDYVI